MQAALYFPYINVPESPWWARTILYWDMVGTIVPRSHREQPDLLDEYTLSLIREGLVRQFLPEDVGPGLRRNFEFYLTNLENREIDRRREAFQRSDVAFVHRDKWMSYGAGLDRIVQLGLAREVSGGWAAVESTTAAEFMAALALAFCQASGRRRPGFGAESWVPATDRTEAFAVLMSGLEPSPRDREGQRVRLRIKGEISAVEVRTELLENLLPVPTTPLTAAQLSEFRRRHGDRLPALRRYLETKVDEALAIDDEILRFRMLDRIGEEVEERVVEAEAYLEEAGLRRISRSSFVRAFKFVPFLKDPIESAQDLAENMMTKPDFESEPLAYLAFARAAFVPTRLYRPQPARGVPLTEAMSDQRQRLG